MSLSLRTERANTEKSDSSAPLQEETENTPSPTALHPLEEWREERLREEERKHREEAKTGVMTDQNRKAWFILSSLHSSLEQMRLYD